LNNLYYYFNFLIVILTEFGMHYFNLNGFTSTKESNAAKKWK